MRKPFANAWVKVLAACAAATLAGMAFAAPAALGLTAAQRLALERTPRLAAYDAAIAAARGRAAAAGNLREATLRLGVDDLPVILDLANGEARGALADRYEREAARATAQKTAVRVDIARETALAWIDCHYAEQMARVATDQLEAAQEEVEGAERMYWAGRLSQAAFYGARSMLVMFEDTSSEIEHQGRTTRIALERYVGDAGRAPLAALPDIDRIRLKPAALEADLARHPAVMLLDKRADIAASEVRITQAGRRSDPEIAAAVARRDELRAERAESLRSEVAAIRIMIDEWQHARDRRDRYARELVPLARERTLATVAAYRGGKGTLAEVLAARRAETEARMQSLEKAREVARMWARLEFVLPEALPSAPRASGGKEDLP